MDGGMEDESEPGGSGVRVFRRSGVISPSALLCASAFLPAWFAANSLPSRMSSMSADCRLLGAPPAGGRSRMMRPAHSDQFFAPLAKFSKATPSSWRLMLLTSPTDVTAARLAGDGSAQRYRRYTPKPKPRRQCPGGESTRKLTGASGLAHYSESVPCLTPVDKGSLYPARHTAIQGTLPALVRSLCRAWDGSVPADAARQCDLRGSDCLPSVPFEKTS